MATGNKLLDLALKEAAPDFRHEKPAGVMVPEHKEIDGEKRYTGNYEVRVVPPSQTEQTLKKFPDSSTIPPEQLDSYTGSPRCTNYTTAKSYIETARNAYKGPGPK